MEKLPTVGMKDFLNSAFGNNPELLAQLIEEKGDVLEIKEFRRKRYLFANPGYVKSLLFNNRENYIRNMGSNFEDFFGKYKFMQSTAEQYSNLWKEDRETLRKLRNQDQMKKYAPILVKIVGNLLDSWKQAADEGSPIYIDQYFTELALSNFLNTVFGGVQVKIRPTMLREAFYYLDPLVFPYVKIFGKVPGPLYFRYAKIKNEFHTAVRDVVKKSFAEDASNSIIKHIAETYGCHTFEQLNDNVKDRLQGIATLNLFAGSDNTSALLTRMSVLLSLYPMVMDKITEEVKLVLGSREPTYDDLSKLTYLNAVIFETLRLYPPVRVLGRPCIKNNTIEGLQIKKGSIVMVSVFGMQRHPKYWINPEGFDPTRFLQPLTEDQQTLFLPFGPVGPGQRPCMGTQLSLMQAKLTFAMLAQRYRLALTAGSSLKLEPGTTFRLHKDITMRVHKV